MSYVVILNSDSGKGGRKPGAEDIRSLFEAHGVSVTIIDVKGGDDIPAKVASAIEQPGIECVVAAGGDGTICAVAGALADKRVDLGVLPLGTFNYFARRFGIPEDVEEAVDAVCRGRKETINLGCVNGRVFINNASIGLYPAILKQRESIYRRWGRSRLAAYWSVVVAMITVYRPLTMRIEVDGKLRSAKAPTVFVGMSAYQLDEFEIEGADAVREGKFAILLAPDCGRYMLIWKALLVALRDVRKGRDFTLLTGERATVETRRSTRDVALDGERRRMKGPFEFSILKDALQVRLPDAASRSDAAE
ncbi:MULTISPECIES: diacylglycerol/lipid kinase family protein [unclassified Roseovarius]|uniref:diacylglycerol/lipid kinase family protein n=1 Tax=unclassified Roseovarius TaxID=2614913 RepID=UPI00273FDBE6|nr:diacylglycerol kinase family protein [Roseovarius sp. MMSF_3350]